MKMSETSEKYQAFIAELTRLCRKHRVSLHVSLYDALDVWDLEDRDTDEDLLNSGGMRDKTNRSQSA
jgi:hypothetical protein